MYRQYADFFKGLSNPRRIKLLKLMMIGGKEITVAQLVRAFDEDASTVSRYLNQLRRLGLLHTRRNGQAKYYWLDRKQLKKSFAEFIQFLSEPDEQVKAATASASRSSKPARKAKG